MLMRHRRRLAFRQVRILLRPVAKKALHRTLWISAALRRCRNNRGRHRSHAICPVPTLHRVKSYRRSRSRSTRRTRWIRTSARCVRLTRPRKTARMLPTASCSTTRPTTDRIPLRPQPRSPRMQTRKLSPRISTLPSRTCPMATVSPWHLPRAAVTSYRFTRWMVSLTLMMFRLNN